MIETVFYIAIIGVFLMLLYKTKKEHKKFQRKINKWDKNINSFVRLHEIKDIDLVFYSPLDSDIKKNIDSDEIISFLDDHIDKGYDFVVAKANKGCLYPSHFHKNSSEYFYVTKGKIKIEIFDNFENKKIKILKTGDTLYILSTNFHNIEMLEDSEYIVIAKPSLFKDVA